MLNRAITIFTHYVRTNFLVKFAHWERLSLGCASRGALEILDAICNTRRSVISGIKRHYYLCEKAIQRNCASLVQTAKQ